jgi:hypothetical protein
MVVKCQLSGEEGREEIGRRGKRGRRGTNKTAKFIQANYPRPKKNKEEKYLPGKDAPDH